MTPMDTRPPHDDPVSDARILAEHTDATPPPAEAAAAPAPGPRPASLALMLSSPLHLISLGFGSGLSPVAPGTVGTLWAWASFALLSQRLGDMQWAVLLLGGTLVGWWACTRTAQAMRTADPGAVVWDEVLAFWAILWVVTPAGWWTQFVAFVLFRFFDAVKPGPVGWADRLFKPRAGQPPGWAQGLGILFDDLIAALCTLIVMALWRSW